MISSLPRIMHMDSTILEKPENAEKLPMGPTISRPGPTLPMQVTTAGKGGAEGEVVHRDQENGRQGDKDIGGEEDHGGAEILLVHHPSVQLDHVDRPGVDDLPDLPADGPQEQQHPGALDGAAGGTSAGADNMSSTRTIREIRPQVEVRAGKAGGGDDGGHLEGGVADGLPTVPNMPRMLTAISAELAATTIRKNLSSSLRRA